MCRSKSPCVFQRVSTRSTLASETSWYSWQLLHPASASVGPDNEESALRNSPYFSEDALISTIAMTMFSPAILMLAFSAKDNPHYSNEQWRFQTRGADLEDVTC